ncbi:MAG: pyrimidine 5'-nucleotidase [Pseudomonadota bacterium]
MSDLAHVNSWIFDLDNTLYPAECQLFAQIDARMTTFVERTLGLSYSDARKIQKDYYVQYGTTLSGLMNEHDVPPTDFMDYVHDIDVSGVAPCARLAANIEALPGRRFVFTNGSVKHAENVLGQLGITSLFDEIFDIAAAGYVPKPNAHPYEAFVQAHNLDPARAIMFEDIAENLRVPETMGMRTVLVCTQARWIDDEPAAKRPAHPDDQFAHVHHKTTDLAGFLEDALQKMAS